MSSEAANRKIIAEELAKDSPNWKRIEDASRQVVDSDPSSVRFSVDAAHIQRLGEHLVGKQETALSELIKNGFDADASAVSLSFEAEKVRGGSLIIEDDGLGMTEEVIRAAWMRISTNSKSEEPVSSRYGRTRAGKKGIGRFAVQRLGRRLVLTTRPAGSTLGYRVQFDWDAAFVSGRDLNDVFSSIERFQKETDEHGTRLEILDLRDAWPKTAIDKAWRAVVLLQPPFDLAASKEETELPGSSENLDPGTDVAIAAPGDPERDPGFRVTINGVRQETQEELFSIEKSFLDLAVARITASIDEAGVGRVRVISQKLGLDAEATSDASYLTTGALQAETRYFIYMAEMLSGIGHDVATRMGREFGGVRIYRNGFRVLPYGEPKDDWLGFDADTARRSLLLPASNRNFFGEVRLSAKQNPLFEETSSREGLLENEAFDELRSFIRWALEWAITRVGEIRNRKLTAHERDFVRRKRPSDLLNDLRSANSSSQKTDESGLPPFNSPDATSGITPSPVTDEQLAEVQAAQLAFEQEVDASRAASLEYEEMLRILASLGLSISVFGHEVKGARGAMASNIILMKDAIEELPNGEARTELDERQSELSRAADRLFDIGGYIAGLMTSTEVRALRDLSVIGAIERFQKQFTDYMSRQKVEFAIDVQPKHIRTTPVHGSELDSVLLNFLTNSIKSMARAKVSPRKVRVEGRLEGEHVVIAFEDNGAGIAAKDRDNVFNAFFTTTGGSNHDDVAGPGTGLGLKIVSDIASSYGGSVGVAEPSEGYTCRMEFRILAHKPAVSV